MRSVAPGPPNIADLLLGFVVAVLTAAQGIVVVATRSEQWAGNWPTSSAAVGWATVWGSCIVSAAAAWLVAAPRRHQYEHLIQASARSRLAIHRTPVFAIGVGGLLGYAAVLGYVVATTGPRATHGNLSIVELAGTLASVPLAIGLGAVVGRMVPSRAAPITAAVVPYALSILLVYAEAYSGSSLFADIFLADQVDRTYLRLPTELLVGRAVFWAGVGVSLLCWAMLAGRAAYTAILVAGFGLSAVLLTAGVRFERPGEYRAVCSGGRPVVCVDRAHEHLGGEYVRRITAAAAGIPGIDFTAFTVVPTETLESESPGGGKVLLVPIVKRNTSPAHEIDPAALAAGFGATLFLAPCQRERAEDETGLTDGDRVAVVLYAWWLATRNLPLDGGNYPGEVDVRSAAAGDATIGAMQDSFARLSATDLAAWIRSNQDRISNCQALPPQ